MPSFGEAAIVGDRIVFNLSMGGSDGPLTLQLISLPLPLIDVDRTTRYAESMRAAFYAATRGEAEYGQMTAELSQTLDTLAKIPDRKQQIAAAEDVRGGLQAWQRNHFSYRSDDVEKLIGLVGDVINELKASVGETTVALELTAGPARPHEALLPAPRLQESLALSLSASNVADVGEDRLAILRTAASIAPAGDRELSASIATRLDQELKAERSYATLATDVRKRAEAAVSQGNVTAIDRLEKELLGRDQQYGFRRPRAVQDLIEELRVARTSAAVRKEALDRYALVRQRLLDYEIAVRPAFSAFDGLRSVLQYFKDRRVVSFDRTVGAEARFARLRDQIAAVAPPAEAGAIHATLVSALRMAVEAATRRREAAATTSAQTINAASAAAAGALLLADRAHEDLVNSLCLGGRVSTCAGAR